MFLIPEMIAQKVTFDCVISSQHVESVDAGRKISGKKIVFFTVVRKIIQSHESAAAAVCVCTYTFLGEDRHESVRASFIILGASCVYVYECVSSLKRFAHSNAKLLVCDLFT